MKDPWGDELDSVGCITGKDILPYCSLSKLHVYLLDDIYHFIYLQIGLTIDDFVLFYGDLCIGQATYISVEIILISSFELFHHLYVCLCDDLLC